MQQRETIFCEKFLLNPPQKHISKRDFKAISQRTGIPQPESGYQEYIKPKQLSSASEKNLARSIPSESSPIVKSKAKGIYSKDFNEQSKDYNLLGISVSKKHFKTVDNQQTKANLFEARQLLKSASKQERVYGYSNSDQIKDTFNQAEPKYYRGLLG